MMIFQGLKHLMDVDPYQMNDIVLYKNLIEITLLNKNIPTAEFMADEVTDHMRGKRLNEGKL